MRLLLVEDDHSLGGGIQAGLALNRHSVAWVTDGPAADQRLMNGHFDAVVLDIGLPKRSGLDVLRDMRMRGDDTPVLILTARDSVADRVQGLDAGGDDYMTKPFDLDELSARLRALHRRHSQQRPTLLTHGNIALDPAAHTVTQDGVPVNLSPNEFSILRMLLEHAGTVLSRSRLEEPLYGWSADVESNTIEVYIHFLRKKLGDNLIRTVRGVGYVVDRRA